MEVCRWTAAGGSHCGGSVPEVVPVIYWGCIDMPIWRGYIEIVEPLTEKVMNTKVENVKLVVCDVRDGQLTSQHSPVIPGIEWLEIPSTRTEAGSYFQYVAAARIPESQCLGLPEHCRIVDDFEHVTKLNIQGEDLEVCYQDAEGHPIQSTIW